MKRTQHKRTRPRRKSGGTRHAKRTKKQKPRIGHDGTYVKRVRARRREAALDHCRFCGSYGRFCDDENAPIVWACLLGCGFGSPRCVKCFPKRAHPKGCSLLKWDREHLTSGCDAFEALLAKSFQHETWNLINVTRSTPTQTNTRKPW